MTSSNKVLTIVLILIALALLYPGVTQPVLTLGGTIERSELAQLGIDMIAGEDASSQTRQMLTMFSSMLGFDQIEGQLQVYRTTRSMWGTVEELAGTGNLAVAILIVFFSLVIPVFKLIVQALSALVPSASLRGQLLRLNGSLSKWSMSDVFVMALLIAFMAGGASEQVGDLLIMDAQLEPGFYYFLAYCLFSIAASTVLARAVGEQTEA